MRPRTLLIVLLALVSGGSAAVGINSLRNQGAPRPETVPVVVAVVDIPPFAVISSDMVKTQDWPKDLVPADALTKVDDALERGALSPLVKGEVVLNGKLAPQGAGRGMAAKVPKGMRAFTIHTPTIEAGVAGFILPGNKVDVLLTLDGRGDQDVTGGSTTVTLLQNLEILAIEQRVVAPADSKVDPTQLKSVTLLVSPQEAARLTLGQSKGRLCLTLRNYSDAEHAATLPVNVTHLLGDVPREQPKEPVKPVVSEPLPPPPAPPPPQPIRTLRGTQEGAVLVQPGPQGR
jgi:pilus assembly protein CpaB